MGEFRWLVTQAFGNEDLPRRVGQMFGGADHVCDLHIVIVDHAGEMVDERAVGALNHMILLAGPSHRNISADVIVKLTRPFARHLQTDDRLAAFAFPLGTIGV